MKITLIVVGRTVEKHYITAINDYIERTKHFISFDMEVIPELKNTKSLTMLSFPWISISENWVPFSPSTLTLKPELAALAKTIEDIFNASLLGLYTLIFAVAEPMEVNTVSNERVSWEKASRWDGLEEKFSSLHDERTVHIPVSRKQNCMIERIFFM